MDDYSTLREHAGVTDLSHLGMVVATGPERVSFLQSILSQDIAHLEQPGQVAHTLLLSPKGKVEHGVIALSLDDDTLLLVTEVGRGEKLLEDLNRWRIRVKCELAMAADEWCVFEQRGPDVDASQGVAWDWPGLPGRLIARRGGGEVAATVEWATREVVRIEAGVPRIGPGLDADESTIPQEAFLDREMVSFTKGCFVGQELVCRIDSRGRVNRYLRGFVIQGSESPPSGAVVSAAGKDVGRTTTSAVSPKLGPIALGYLRREVELPAAVTLRWDGGEANAEARELPLIS